MDRVFEKDWENATGIYIYTIIIITGTYGTESALWDISSDDIIYTGGRNKHFHYPTWWTPFLFKSHTHTLWLTVHTLEGLTFFFCYHYSFFNVLGIAVKMTCNIRKSRLSKREEFASPFSPKYSQMKNYEKTIENSKCLSILFSWLRIIQITILHNIAQCFSKYHYICYIIQYRHKEVGTLRG